MSHCHAARSRPEHALRFAEGVRMTLEVRWGTLCHETPLRPSMKPHVIVSEANDLAACTTHRHGSFHSTAHHGPQCHPVRSLPEHALSFAEGVRMTMGFQCKKQ